AVHRALGIAAAQAAGFREAFGTMVKSFHVGKAAMNGILAALLAAEGFTAPDDPFGGRRGFASVFGGHYDPAPVAEMGRQWEIFADGFKPYACGLVIHPSVDGVLALQRQYGFGAQEVERIELEVHPHVLDLTGKRDPRTGLEGKFSVYYAVAAALLDGQLYEEQFSDERVQRPAAIELYRRVEATVDPSLGRGQARVRVLLRDGTRVETFVTAATGTPANPMSDSQLEQKFMALVVPVTGEAPAHAVVQAVRDLDRVASAADLLSNLVSRA
ncbi:MAG TPA: MmgE/PrpD family protein, partial [Bacillota bacterium]